MMTMSIMRRRNDRWLLLGLLLVGFLMGGWFVSVTTVAAATDDAVVELTQDNFRRLY